MIYESEYDRQCQNLFGDILEMILPAGKKLWRRPTTDIMDFVITNSDGQVSSLLEFKRRLNNSDKYPTFQISGKKILGLSSLAKAYKCFAFLNVAFDDTVMRLDITDTNNFEHKLVMGGRFDRDDPNDIEIMFDIPVRCFEHFKSKDIQNISWPRKEDFK